MKKFLGENNMALGGLIKSKQQRQLERGMAIQGVLDLPEERN